MSEISNRQWLRSNWLFYGVAIVLTLGVAMFYLSSTHSGDNWAWRGLPLDDTWIHLVYARAIADHGWFAYNPGIAEAGMSSPLWVVVLAIVYKIFTPFGVSPQWCAKGLSLLMAMGVPMLTYHIALTLKLDRRIAWLAGILVIIEPNTAYGNVSGMEVSLTALLILAAIWSSLREKYIITGTMLGLLVIARGEGTVVALIIGVVPLIQQYVKREDMTLATEQELILGVKLFLPPLVLGGAWALYNYSINESFLPNTYYVKHNYTLGYINPQNLLNVWLGYGRHLAFFQRLAIIFSLGGLVAGGVGLYQKKQFKPLAYLVLIPVVHIYLFSINIKVNGGDVPWTYFTRRYPDFILPIVSLLLIVGSVSLWQKATEIKNRLIVLTLPIIYFIAAGLLGYNIVTLNNQLIETYSWDTENIETVDVAMGRWIGENLPPEVTIGVTDAGAIRFFSQPDQYIIDVLGLNCQECFGHRIEFLLEEIKPDYLIFFRQGLHDGLQYEELHSLRPERVTILGGRELVAIRFIGLTE